jgi:hypothetical protein
VGGILFWTRTFRTHTLVGALSLDRSLLSLNLVSCSLERMLLTGDLPISRQDFLPLTD